MKIPFLSGAAPKDLHNEEDIGTCRCSLLAEPEPISYATEFRDFLQNNAPLDFNTKMARARPFIFASFIAWPAYWMYRGMDWSNRAHVERSLVNYINKTFHHAKIMQFAILGVGLTFAMYEDSQLLNRVNNMLNGIDNVDYRVPRNVNFGEELRRLMHRSDIEEAMSAASPFLMAAGLAWPTVWLYRGIDWHSKKGKMTLPLYIRQTYFQAKAVQFAVLGVGLIYAVANAPRRSL